MTDGGKPVKRVFAGMLLASLLATAAPASAQPPGGRRAEPSGPAEGRPALAPEGQPAPRREHRRDADAREEHHRRHAHMTPEERRQLRRDIHQHGREVYRERRREER